MLGTSTVVLSFKMFSLYLLWVDFSSWNNGFRFMLLIDFSIFLKIHLFLWNEFKINFSKTYVCACIDFWTEVQYDTCIRCSVELWNVKSFLHLLMINFYYFITIFNSDELLGIRYPRFNQFFLLYFGIFKGSSWYSHSIDLQQICFIFRLIIHAS